MMGAVPELDGRSEDRTYSRTKGKAPLTVHALADALSTHQDLGLLWCPPFCRGCVSADRLLG
jgi:hypothetical protein